jgi:hypothetical protein
VAYDWRQASGQAAALKATIGSSTAASGSRPIIEGSPPPPPGPAPRPTVADVTVDGANTVTLDAVAKRPGYLILDDSAYPGWDASIDGRSVPWLPANENFRAVRIPAGRHVVSFRYRPASVYAGAVITFLTTLALLGIGIWSVLWHRRRRRD